MENQNSTPMPTFEQSESIKDLASALSKAQAEVMKAHRDSNNPFFNSNYADLTSVWDAIRKPFSDNNLSVSQWPVGRCSLVTTIMHASGQWQRSMMTVRPKKDDAQGVGSAITYMRRYALQSVAGVCPTDDDANNAIGIGEPHLSAGKKDAPKDAEPKVDHQQSKRTPSEAQLKRLFALTKQAGFEDAALKNHIKAKYGVDSRKDLSIDQYNELCNKLIELEKNKL